MAEMIGFIGVGTMGEPMCRNLARKSGATVLAADRNPEPLKRLAADGVKTASLDEIVAQLPHDLPVAAGRQGSRGGVPGRGRAGLQGRRSAARSSTPAPRRCRSPAGSMPSSRARPAPSPMRRSRARGRRRSTARCRSWSAARSDDLRAHRAAAAPPGERGHALRRGGRGAGGQDPEQHDPVPDRGRRWPRRCASPAPTASTARCCSTR